MPSISRLPAEILPLVAGSGSLRHLPETLILALFADPSIPLAARLVLPRLPLQLFVLRMSVAFRRSSSAAASLGSKPPCTTSRCPPRSTTSYSARSFSTRIPAKAVEPLAAFTSTKAAWCCVSEASPPLRAPSSSSTGACSARFPRSRQKSRCVIRSPATLTGPLLFPLCCDVVFSFCSSTHLRRFRHVAVDGWSDTYRHHTRDRLHRDECRRELGDARLQREHLAVDARQRAGQAAVVGSEYGGGFRHERRPASTRCRSKEAPDQSSVNGR